MARTKPKYAVNIAFKAWDIAKAGVAVELRVRGRRGLVGTIQIGQGSFGWKAANKQSFKRISWDALAARLRDS